MMNKKGEMYFPLKLFMWIAGIFAVISLVGLFFFGEFGIPQQITEGAKARISEATSQTTSNNEILGPRAAFLDFVYGQIPSFLIEWTNETSALIIIIGIWVLLFLSFGDILSLFGTFSPAISWIIGGVLAIIAANFKILSFISVVGLVLASGLGTIAVFVNIIAIFIIFILFNYGKQEVREWVWKRKVAELKLRAAMGSAKAEAGLTTMAEIGKTSYELGR